MQQFNYPTKIYYGEDSVKGCAQYLKDNNLKKPLFVTDKTLSEIGLANKVMGIFKEKNIKPILFDDVHPNPLEEDAINGAEVYTKNNCDSVIALGGGSPMDAAKGIMILATNAPPLKKYDDALGGDKYVTNPLPPLFAIPTTAGTGSEVGRAGVLTIKENNTKTIIFHPTLMPTIAVLEPELTKDLPKAITVATGLDAFTHCLEAFFAAGFHPLSDGIAHEGMRLVLKNLKTVTDEPHNLKARGEMLMAASMGATAFQKGLGMIHAIAHPLSSECGLHHGLANALMLPYCIKFLEEKELNDDQKERLNRVQSVFKEFNLDQYTLSESCTNYFESMGIEFGLKNHGVTEDHFQVLAKKAYADVSHQTNMIQVTQEDLLNVIKAAY